MARFKEGKRRYLALRQSLAREAKFHELERTCKCVTTIGSKTQNARPPRPLKFPWRKDGSLRLMQSQLYMVSKFFALELLIICSLHCVGYFSDKHGSNRIPAYPNLIDYEWTSKLNEITNEVVSAQEQYIRDTKECFHHFYEAIAQPKSHYWSSSKLDQWPQIMAEQP